ncbi:choice-of-anchor L domain-containing protein [Flavobacterium sp. Arc2]|uniref:T9SS type B sorting domain-containing protein n=1 Tax=Flavobacterium sp. Arc2 TaxID=3046685 RepID=UPI00352BD867
MKSLKIISIYFFLFFIPLMGSAQSITVNDSYTAQNLVDLLTNNGSCSTTSNPSVSGDTFSGTQKSYGSFNSGTSSFPFTEGVLLSTWSSVKSKGPYVENIPAADSNQWLGDPDLDTVLGKSTLNATVLEFDFTPLTNFLSFDYIFASNEYQSFFPCSYSDAFAFLIKESGSTAPYQNLALIPNTTIPLTSTNVHPLIPAVNPPPPFGTNGCPAVNESYFGAFNTSSSPINYAGQTVVMNARTNVIPNKTYHIKLVIADNESTTFNSAVFIKAGSFKSKIDLGTDRLVSTNNGICYGENYVINTSLPLTNTYKWYKDNILIAGETSASYTAKAAGTYRFELDVPNCTSSGEIKIEYTPEIVLNNTTLVQCDDNGDGISTFNLTKVDSKIKNNDSSLNPVVYYETLAEAKGSSNAIANSTSYTNKSQNQILYAKVTNSYGCEKYAELTLQISNESITPQNPFTTCDADASQDGLSVFDLKTDITPAVLNGLPAGLDVEYYLSPVDAILQNNAFPNLFNNTNPYQQIIFAKIINGPDCYDIIPITLIVDTFSPPNFEDVNASLCNGNSLNLSIAKGFSSYLWNTGETTNSITLTSEGDYFVTVTNSNGCTATKNFYINSSEIATINGATINDFAGNENSVAIEYTGSGDYEFSIDGSYFQDNPQFEGIAAGTYIASARDKNGCGLSDPFVFYVLDYPRYFTPNGDGYNDFWNIDNLDLLPKSTITIFNRYGKLLKEISPSSVGWNGTYTGHPVVADDYWFNLTFEDGKIINGHFSLKR